MDVEKLLLLGPKYLHDYLEHLTKVLSANTLNFPHVLSDGTVHRAEELNPELLVFVLVSVIVGFFVNKLTVPQMELWPTVVVCLVAWLLFAFLESWLCVLLRGAGSARDTFALVLQVLGAVYVVAAVATFLLTLGTYGWISVHRGFFDASQQPIDAPWYQILWRVWLDPKALKEHDVQGWDVQLYSAHALIHTLLTASYLGVALRRLHRFGVVGTFVVTASVLIGLFFKWLLAASIFMGTNGIVFE